MSFDAFFGLLFYARAQTYLLKGVTRFCLQVGRIDAPLHLGKGLGICTSSHFGCEGSYPFVTG